jgi:hypothetical protein
MTVCFGDWRDWCMRDCIVAAVTICCRLAVDCPRLRWDMCCMAPGCVAYWGIPDDEYTLDWPESIRCVWAGSSYCVIGALGIGGGATLYGDSPYCCRLCGERPGGPIPEGRYPEACSWTCGVALPWAMP